MKGAGKSREGASPTAFLQAKGPPLSSLGSAGLGLCGILSLRKKHLWSA